MTAFVADDSLCAPLILGLPFLKYNQIVIDHDAQTALSKIHNVDLLNPVPLSRAPVPKSRIPKNDRLLFFRARLDMMDELRAVLKNKFIEPLDVKAVDNTTKVIAAIERLEHAELLRARGDKLKTEFHDVFDAIPHVDELPTDITMKITLKEAEKTIVTRSYQSPRKYKEAWATLIKKHLDAGRIRPSQSKFASPAFLIPKADPSALPRWVNDFRQLNANTVPDRFPLRRIDDILADAAKGRIWGQMDMTDSFFQTRLDPESIPYTAVNTPLGLYEWLVMPQGLRNAPSVQQRRVTHALRDYIGKFCHVYLDDIIIWSQSEDEHEEHIRLILAALRKDRLYCNPKKCMFFQESLDFLGYHISRKGVSAQDSKVAAVTNFPRPKSAEEVRRFLGLVRFIAGFLENLAEYTRKLTPLTKSVCNKSFPPWSVEHEEAFQQIKRLVTSREVLMTIDHENPGEDRIFLTCDTSDWRSGAILSWGKSLATSRPVAFESQAFTGPELNYPVHEKELLAIVRALKKWRADCLGMPLHVLTDHRTLENFTSQKDLSRRQLRWQEFLAQYDLTIAYIKGTENCGADALSRVENGRYTHEQLNASKFYRWPELPSTHAVRSVAATLALTTNGDFLREVLAGYTNDEYGKKLLALPSLPPEITQRNGLFYHKDRLVVPGVGSLREDLFRLAHDAVGHYGFDKSYAYLKDSFFWPSMRTELEKYYIPGCDACQRNKPLTRKNKGPLHPTPTPDGRLSSVGLDFVGPLPEDNGFDCILTMTCRLHADLRIAAVKTTLTAEELAEVFYREWYLENGLPDNIFCDRDKLFMSKFWLALMERIGVDIKASSCYHPESDGLSERSNQTIIQSLRYFVDNNQKGWFRSLPIVRFNIMNSVVSSTGFSMFMLKTGRSPRVIPPISVESPPQDMSDLKAREIIQDILNNEESAKDALVVAKVSQAFHANKGRGPVPKFSVGDRVMLTTVHRRHRSKADKGLAAKFFARWDGPYTILKSHAKFDSYVLDTPDSENKTPVYYIENLKPYIDNDDDLFPRRTLERPEAIMVNGDEEYVLDKIVRSRRRGRGWQFLVQWKGYGKEDQRWLPYSELRDCEVLDTWIKEGGRAPEDAMKATLVSIPQPSSKAPLRQM